MTDTKDTPPPVPPAIKPRGGRSRGGRPKGDPLEVRTRTIGVRVSLDEMIQIMTKSEAMNMTPTNWLREAALSRRLPSPPIPAVNREAYAELGKLASNLNQLARSANSGRPVAVSDDLLHQVLAELTRLRQGLLNLRPEKDEA